MDSTGRRIAAQSTFGRRAGTFRLTTKGKIDLPEGSHLSR
jgi:hypothetical protein